LASLASQLKLSIVFLTGDAISIFMVAVSGVFAEVRWAGEPSEAGRDDLRIAERVG
jgi:hypothetical protein